MQAQIVGPQDWWEVETNQGTSWVQCEDVGYKDDVTAVKLLDFLPETHDTDDIMRWEFKSGYGARLSAPGYLDCTEWTVFDTEDEAREHLYEMWDICPACLDSRQDAKACKCVQEMSDDVWYAWVHKHVSRMSTEELLAMPGVYEAASELFNNKIIETLGEVAIEQWRESVRRKRGS
jgi:hypothetical protein